MFYLYHHNDLGRLAELFSVLRTRHRIRPLEMDTVLVPNRGMGRWLSIQLAQSDGIVSNLRSALPGGYIWELLTRVSPGADQGKHFEPSALPWHLYLALPTLAEHIPAVDNYLGTPVDEVRRWQLARQLADVFDKYLVYRADMLADWQRGETPAQDPGRWQAQVWRELTRDDFLGGNHRAHVLRQFVSRLRDDHGLQQRVAEYCPRNLYCFGLMAVAPDHLRLLYALARQIDVHFMLPNPSEVYWGEVTSQRVPLALPIADAPAADLPGEMQIESEHALLGTLGRMARDTLRVLYSDEFAGMIEPEFGDVMAYRQPGNDSLLRRIQTGIVTLDCRHPDQGMSDADTSLDIHACHSPLREIQVLQDQLLDRLAADDKRVANGEIDPDERLAPRDIIVMLPDMARYAPAIKAVFGGAAPDRHLPFGLADRAHAATHPIVACFASLLDLPLARWRASELLDLLAVPAVMRRFNLSGDEVDRLTEWIREAGIRWGRDAHHRQQLGAGAFAQNSWRFGLDRLLLGVVQSDDETLVDDVAPWSDLEGHGTAALGKLWRFERTLSQCARTLAEAATPGQWQTRLNQLVDALLAPAADAPDEQRAIDNLRQLFAEFETVENCTQEIALHEDRRIAWQTARDMLHDALDSASERQPFLAGGITFCGMVPLRAVPFRVVCVLGLDDGAFPRQDSNRAFSVMYQQPRLGDRNTRDDDRLLFLQALTAARDAFYISYIGQDVNSGETRAPSPLVGELLAFIKQTYFRDWAPSAVEQRLIHHQPMQPFSARYFSTTAADPRIFTYAGHWRDATLAQRRPRGEASAWLDDTPAPLAEPVTTVDLTTLTRFFADPPRFFFEQRLGLQLATRDTKIDDEEPLQLDDLAKARLRRRLFERAARDDGAAIDTTPDALAQARGTLPPPPRAKAAFSPEAEVVNALLPILRAWQPGMQAARSVDIDLTLAGVRLTGRVPAVGKACMYRLRPGRLKTRYRLDYWLAYLAVVASGHEVDLAMAGLGSKKQRYKPVALQGRVSPEQAHEHLQALISAYVQGQQRPLPFHPDLVDDFDANQDDALANLGWRFTDAARPYSTHHLCRDYYFPLLLGADDAPLGRPDDSPFLDAINRISAPMVATLQRIEVTPTATAENTR